MPFAAACFARRLGGALGKVPDEMAKNKRVKPGAIAPLR